LRRNGTRWFEAGEGAGMAFGKLEVQLFESVSSRGELGYMEGKRELGKIVGVKIGGGPAKLTRKEGPLALAPQASGPGLGLTFSSSLHQRNFAILLRDSTF
jgi:hypothetical protein